MEATSSAITLDHLVSGPTTLPSPETHLHYPPFQDAHVDEPKRINEPAQLHRDRLYIGNLHPSVDEYALVQVFSKFGKITKLDFLFHKTGALKGKPRGYAFVEYATPDEAHKAKSMAHDKLLRGRKLVVTLAQQAPVDQYALSGSLSSRPRKPLTETGRPTTLSLLKSGPPTRNGQEGKTQDKIAVMEAKLRQLEEAKTQSSNQGPTSAGPLSHPSLPAKPPAPLPLHVQDSLAKARNPTQPVPPKLAATKALPKLPLPLAPVPPSSANPKDPPPLFRPPVSRPSIVHPKAAKSKLLGVKIKSKGKESEPTKD